MSIVSRNLEERKKLAELESLRKLTSKEKPEGRLKDKEIGEKEEGQLEN